MQKLFLATLVLFALASFLYVQKVDQKPNTEFELHKIKYGLKYSVMQNAYREAIFNENVKKVNIHNSNPDRTYDMGINQFTTLTQEEFVQQYLGYKPKVNVRPLTVEESVDIIVGDVDWTTSGGVGKVKDQGQCGSCWAFSTIASLQYLNFHQNGNLTYFSEQQLVDCSTLNAGCNGGSMALAFAYTASNGITTEAAYPYTAKDGQCQTKQSAFKNKAFLQPVGCALLGNAINNRPISVAVDATNWSPYKSGIFNNCGTGLNHGVFLVGSTTTYWKIKNSWSASWGENGYIRLDRGNTCGICNQPTYPV